MLDAMLRAIRDFIAENPGLNPHVVEKLSFAYSDLGHLASTITRFCQHAESLAPVAVPSTATRLERNCWEQVSAAHYGQRQLVFHLSRGALMFLHNVAAGVLVV